MMTLKDYQTDAINELTKKIKKYLGQSNAPKIYLEAPTGAGKTVIASKVLEDLAATLPYDYDSQTQRVAFIWIAPNKLHEQSYLSMKSFFKYTNSLRPMVWDELDHSLGYLEHGDILFLNWPSITRDDNLILRDTEQRTGLYEVVRKTRTEQHTPVVVIIDEEHLYSGASADKATLFLNKIQPDIELRISATPNYPKGIDYERIYINRKDVVKEGMIKKDVVINPGVDTQKANDEALGVDAYFLKLALQKREELKRCYERIGGPVNPLLLIQLPNDKKAVSADDNKILDTVKTYLRLPQVDITEENGRLGIWLSEDKKNLADIAKPDNLTEVLIFKEAISKGWDCPRAAVLLIYRSMKSFSFTVQTVGRILRMPSQRFYSDDALNHGYVFTNLENEYIEIKQDEMDYVLQSTAVLRRNIAPISLPASAVGTHKVQNALGYRFRKILKDTFVEMWHLNEPMLNFSYDDEEEEKSDEENEALQNNIKQNREMMARQGIDLDVHKIYTVVPKDMTVDVDKTGRYKVPDDGKARLARTQGEVDRMFVNFCMANLIQFDKRDSTKAMSAALIKFMEDFAQYNELEAKKIILFNENRPKFVKVMKKAQERYAKEMQARMEKAKQVESQYGWTLPSVRGYNSDTHHAMPQITGHALQPFYELNTASVPEKHFRDFLEQHREGIEWWYKNGDSGQEHFSVVYTGADGKKGNFYVDFIIKLRNGRLCLFDTKDASGGIGDTKEKHNRLIDYIDDYNTKNGTNIVGGIIVEERGQWLYSPMHISDAAEHGGWQDFNPEELNR